MGRWGSIPFKKMHGSGNDFILIDNRQKLIPASEAQDAAVTLCKRGFGIGADGLILIEDSDKAHFKWRFLNADGSHADMCGNGGRCAARFAYMLGIAPAEMTFETGAGIIKAEVKDGIVKLQLPDPTDLDLDQTLKLHDQELTIHYINTGVPHTVVFFPDISSAPVFEIGRLIRHHRRFAPEGTNVDFVEVVDKDFIKVRTYERGVEDETQACGTGAVASAIVSTMKGQTSSPVEVETWGGERLKVYFDLDGNRLSQVFLEGRAVLVYSGTTEEL